VSPVSNLNKDPTSN